VEMMKYTMMLCWVDRQEASEIKAENKKHNIPIMFAHNYEEFRALIDDTNFLVISTKKARYKKTFDMVRKFPNNIFHAFYKTDGLPVTMIESDFYDEPNVSPGKYCPQYEAPELFTAFYKGL
jgi:hypothetical protein